MMKTARKSVSLALLAIVMVVSACQAKATPTASPTAIPPTATSAPIPTQPPPADPSEPVEVSAPEVPGVCEVAPLPELPVRAEDSTDWAKGASKEAAKITLYEYSDFQCPGCGGMAPIVEAFIEDNPDVRLVYRHFPLDFHPNAGLAAEAAEAAGAQGKFWEMHDLLFSRSSEWGSLPEDAALSKMTEYAKSIGLDADRFAREVADDTYAAKVQSHYNEARELGLPGTPSFIYNNVLFPSYVGLSYTGLSAFKGILANQDTLFYAAPPEQSITVEDVYEATLKTSKGDIVVTLLPVSAPVHVNSFIFLSQEKWYDGSEFFFVQDNFVAVSGDPTNSTIGYPGYYCEGEEQGVFDRAGLVGMLASGQFFITLGSDASQLSGQFALIGQVTKGLDVLQRLARRQLGDPTAPMADVVETIAITKR